MSSDDRIRVAAVDDFAEGDRKIVDVDGVDVGVLNVADEFYAIENRCCHDSGPVSAGTVRERLEAEFTTPGERVQEDYTGDLTITCPWHGWEYDLESGVHIGDPSYALSTYDVFVEDGEVYVSTSEDSSPV